MTMPVVITVYADRSFDFVVKSPPAGVLLKKEANVAKGSGVPNKEKVGKVTKAQIRKIAEIKLNDLNAFELEKADRIIEGTAPVWALKWQVKGRTKSQSPLGDYQPKMGLRTL